MDLLRAFVLGLLQGITEFVPVSSSGHLVFVPWLLGWQIPTLVFDTVVHWGTLVAVVAYFWRDWWELITAWLDGLAHRDWSDPKARLMWLLILGSVPAAIIGYLLNDFFESLFSRPVWVGVFLLVTATVLALGEWLGKQTRGLDDLRWRDALLIGLSQAAAIAPGISRSGATMATGLFRGVERPTAARFSFLLSTPVILGAGLFPLLDLFGSASPGTQMPALLVGFVAAAASGYACIWFLLRYLRQGKLYPFAIYCALMGSVCLVAGALL